MTTTEWWAIAASALVLGTALGALLMLKFSRVQLSRRTRKVTEELQQRHASHIDQFRAAQVRAQTELEQARATFKRQLAVATEEPRAAIQRAEERLKGAYAELDRLRAAARTGQDSALSELGDGFAATRPMREGM